MTNSIMEKIKSGAVIIEVRSPVLNAGGLGDMP